MFTPIQPEAGRSRVWPRVASTAAHGIILLWLLHSARPQVLTPSFAKAGVEAGTVTKLYWPVQSPEQSIARESESRSQPTTVGSKLTWRAARKASKAATPVGSSPEGDSQSSAAEQQPVQAAASGSAYGSVSDGSSQMEIRPALPVSTSDPRVDPAELRGGIEGDVIVEITIDERGNIVQKVVLTSLTKAIDNQVLAALESWRFRPATRDGVAIASKQDVYYHFPK